MKIFKSLVDSHASDCPRTKLPEFIRLNWPSGVDTLEEPSDDEKPPEGLGGDFYCPTDH